MKFTNKHEGKPPKTERLQGKKTQTKTQGPELESKIYF